MLSRPPKYKSKNLIPQPKIRVTKKDTMEESVNPKLYQRRLKFMDSGRHFGKDLTNQNNSKPSSLSKKPTYTANSQEKVSLFFFYNL